jgi:peptidoglycan/LPS O-acetylase OafA/YrhL
MPWSPPLTGLRGGAIVLVLLFHATGVLPNGGPVGVTVFFVLSGYLITGILVAQIRRTGRIDLRAFLARRARRLLPALVVVVTAVLIVTAALGHAPAVVPDSLLTLAYVSNWARAAGDGMGLWNHSWSLAIEAQFYLLWPLTLVVFGRRLVDRPMPAVVFVLALAALSALLRVGLAAGGASADRLYFGTDTRAEALLVGCALALFESDARVRAVPRWVGPSSLIAIIALTLAPGMDHLWIGSSYSGVAIATALLILALRHGGPDLGLASRPLTWLGDRSYGLYLWHVPVLMVIGADATAWWWTNALPVAASVVLAALSYRFVERPFLSPAERHDPPVLLRADSGMSQSLPDAA